MFEKFISADAPDFRQRYQGTYGYFTHKGKRTLCRLDKISTEGSRSFVEFSDRDGLKYLLHPDSEDDSTGFEFLPPKSSYFNTKEGIPLLVNRVPARQYLRGICDRNTAIYNMRNKMQPVDFSTLVKLFEESVSIKDALAVAMKSEDGAAGVALNQAFALCIGTSIVKCFNQQIGVFDHKEGLFTVALDSPELWGQEITDAFRRAKLNMIFK